MGSTATIVTTGSIQEMDLHICASSHIASRLQAGGAVE